MKSVPDALKFTYQDYLLTPEDKRYELIDGDLLMTPSPTPFHQKISRRLLVALTLFVDKRSLGEVLAAPCDAYFSRHDLVQPDLLFVAAHRLAIIEEPYIQGAPDLVVGILSPASLRRDRELKLRLYARHGVREYWIVDPDARTVEVLSRRQRDFRLLQCYQIGDALESPLLEGFRLPLEEVFKK